MAVIYPDAERNPRVKQRFDIGTSTIYVGTAVIGTADATAGWTIKKITLVSGSPTTVQWSAEGTATWNNRATETYS